MSIFFLLVNICKEHIMIGIRDLVYSLAFPRRAIWYLMITAFIVCLISIYSKELQIAFRFDSVFEPNYGRSVLYDASLSLIKSGKLGFNVNSYMFELPRMTGGVVPGGAHNAWLDSFLLDGLVLGFLIRCIWLLSFVLPLLLLKSKSSRLILAILLLSFFFTEFTSEAVFGGWGYKTLAFSSCYFFLIASHRFYSENIGLPYNLIKFK